ncbi:hypothetical protein QN354_08510 [Cryobacterium sp. 5I3]|uniref:hypothetical protein n=1 Tax=Cryobacterium sp. 5I3 TaxID=3048592 RepID=UPI002B2320B9|nr:hypothetical protein [Cryobacterium sp. 5I3]MEB0201798.1 hypothetical protein [Cryobacterium sp. 5I3]
MADEENARPDASEDTPADTPAHLRFLTRGISPVEAAAVSAVLHGLLREETGSLHKKPTGARSGWQAGQRAIRPPFVSGQSSWGEFRV